MWHDRSVIPHAPVAALALTRLPQDPLTLGPFNT